MARALPGDDLTRISDRQLAEEIRRRTSGMWISEEQLLAYIFDGVPLPKPITDLRHPAFEGVPDE